MTKPSQRATYRVVCTDDVVYEEPNSATPLTSLRAARARAKRLKEQALCTLPHHIELWDGKAWVRYAAGVGPAKKRPPSKRHAVEVRQRHPQPSMWVPGGRRNGLTFTDIFCGAGGSSIGLANAGFELALAANHWDRAIETHSANFRDADHLCADVNNYDMRRLPRTNVLWASPICTELSPAGGTSGYRRPKGKRDGQLDMLEELGHVPKDGKDRTRATFHDVIRAAEVHRYEMVFVENVPDVVDRWELFDWWVDGMRRLGYQVQFLSVSSAHVGGDGIPWAPQWRDRLYMVFTRKDIGRQPDVTVRPWSLCTTCGEVVQGVQTWCRSVQGRLYKVGRYRRNPNSSYGQYWYSCPNRRCQGARVEPFVLPAAAAIDWSDLGTRIGDMPRYPKPNTIARIEAGLQMFGQPTLTTVAGNTFERPGYLRVSPVLGAPMGTQQCTTTDALVWPGSFIANSNHDDTRVYPVDGRPLAACTTKIGDALVCPPMTMPVGGTWADESVNVMTSPMRTQMANEKGCEALVTPEAFLAVLRNHATAVSLGEPMPTLAAQGNHFALVVPYYTTRTKARTTDEPLDTVPTRDRFALVAPAVAVDDCRLRMLKPRESLAAQTFPGDYTVRGNLGEQTMQAGNAVSCNVAQFLAERAAPVLCN